MRKTHQLKTTTSKWAKYNDQFFWTIRENDRDFKVGDVCLFQEVKMEDGRQVYTNEWTVAKITRILLHVDFPQGLQKGYCIMDMFKLDGSKNI